MAIRMAMIAITTSSSTNVNARLRDMHRSFHRSKRPNLPIVPAPRAFGHSSLHSIAIRKLQIANHLLSHPLTLPPLANLHASTILLILCAALNRTSPPNTSHALRSIPLSKPLYNTAIFPPPHLHPSPPPHPTPLTPAPLL